MWLMLAQTPTTAPQSLPPEVAWLLALPAIALFVGAIVAILVGIKKLREPPPEPQLVIGMEYVRKHELDKKLEDLMEAHKALETYTHATVHDFRTSFQQLNNKLGSIRGQMQHDMRFEIDRIISLLRGSKITPRLPLMEDPEEET